MTLKYFFGIIIIECEVIYFPDFKSLILFNILHFPSCFTDFNILKFFKVLPKKMLIMSDVAEMSKDYNFAKTGIMYLVHAIIHKKTILCTYIHGRY